MFLMLYKRRKGIGYLFLFWASLIALSQVYVGVHFPLDILAGALLGMVVAGFMYLLYQKLYARTYLDGKYD